MPRTVARIGLGPGHRSEGEGVGKDPPTAEEPHRIEIAVAGPGRHVDPRHPVGTAGYADDLARLDSVTNDHGTRAQVRIRRSQRRTMGDRDGPIGDDHPRKAHRARQDGPNRTADRRGEVDPPVSGVPTLWRISGDDRAIDGANGHAAARNSGNGKGEKSCEEKREHITALRPPSRSPYRARTTGTRSPRCGQRPLGPRRGRQAQSPRSADRWDGRAWSGRHRHHPGPPSLSSLPGHGP